MARSDRPETDPRCAGWARPITPEHKAWLRANLVSRPDLAAMLGVSAHRINKAADAPDWPAAVIGQPWRQRYWWPRLAPALATRGWQIAPGFAAPADGPVPSWWGDMPTADPDGWRAYLALNLMDFARFAAEYFLNRATIMRISRYDDYPTPLLGQPGAHWYWWPELDQFIMRHPEIR